MKKFGILLSSMTLLFVVHAHAQAQGQNRLSLSETERSPFKGEWMMGLSGASNQDAQSTSKKVDMRLGLRATYELTSNLLFDVQPVLRLQSGQTQSVDGADSPENKILLNQAAVSLHSDNFNLMAGALQQQTLHSQLLIDKMSFPGARAQAFIRTLTFDTGISAETAIPTSTSMSTNTSELEPTPSFSTVSLNMNWQGSKRAFWKNKVGYFAFKDLPTAVAQKSSLLGNEVSSLSETDYRFKYEHSGVEATTALSVPVTRRLTGFAGAEFVQNQQAPSDLNTATYFYAGGEIYFSRNFSWALSGGALSVAPEAAVSYFSAGAIETNRVGYVVESIFKFQRERFNLSVKYMDTEVMYETDYQSREKFLRIALETSYVSI